jgi:hypothetical protein
MSVVIVSDGSDLAFALGTRTEAVGVSSADLDRFLADERDVTAVVVDVGSADAAITRVVDAFRGRLLPCPIVVVAAPDALSEDFLHTNSPIGVITRPFTMERLLDRLLRLSASPAAVPPVTPPIEANEGPEETATSITRGPTPAPEAETGGEGEGNTQLRPAARPDAGDRPEAEAHRRPEPQPGPPLDPQLEPTPEPDPVIDISEAAPVVAAAAPPTAGRRLFGRRTTQQPATVAPPPSATTQAIRVLATTDELASVSDVAEAVVSLLSEQMGEGVALMVLDDIGWRVAAGRGLRPIETRGVLERRHWLAHRLESEQTAVVVSGTDLVRQDLRGVPLIHHEQWMATTIADAPAIIVRGREGDLPYTIEDALESRRQAAQLGRDLQAAIELRVLARRLAAYRDRPE